MSTQYEGAKGMDRRAMLLGGVAAGALLATTAADAPPASATTTNSPLWYNAELYPTQVKRAGTASDNTTNFNAMVTAVSTSGGGVIYFPGGSNGDPNGNSGVYRFNGVLRMKNNVTIRGDGPSTTQFVWEDNSVTNGYIVYFNGVNNAKIVDIGFDAGASQTLSNAVSIKVNQSTEITVERCRFTNLRRAIDIFNGSSKVRIRGNNFQSNTVGLAVSVMPQSGAAPSDIEISGNTFDGITKDTEGRDLTPLTAIYSQGVRVHALNNWIANSDDTGIMFGSGSIDSSAIANVIYTQLVSIFVGNGSLRTRVIGNSLRSQSDHGIHAYNRDGFSNAAYTVISSNTISECGKTGIHIEGANGVNCVGNTILNPGRRPVDNDKVTPREITGILVSNNYVKDAAGNPLPPTNFAYNCNITANIIIDDNPTAPTMKYGIRLSDAKSNGTVVSGNTVSNAAVARILYPSTLPPAAEVPPGTAWWSGTKPIWGNGTVWVDSTGTPV